MIEHIRVRNWKGLAGKEIALKQGLTFILGENGSGKTTLLEAVCVAITGEALTADVQSMVRQDGGGQEAEIGVTLGLPDGRRVSIVRRFRRDRKLLGELTIDGQSTGIGSWDEITHKVLQLLSIDKLFFARLVYMAEGEVFSYLQDPPRQALRQRMDQVLGIHVSTSLLSRLARFSRHYVGLREETVAELRKLQPEARKGVPPPSNLQEMLEALRAKERAADDGLSAALPELSVLSNQVEDLQRALEVVARVTQLLQEAELSSSGRDLRDTLEEALRSLREEVERREEETNTNHTRLGAATNKLQSLKEVSHILESVSAIAESREVPCPVCHRPIDANLSRRLMATMSSQIVQTQQEVAAAQESLGLSQRMLASKRETLQHLQEAHAKLSQHRRALESLERVSIEAVDNRIRALREQLETKQTQTGELRTQLETIRRDVRLRTEEVTEARLREQEGERKARLERKLVSAYRGELLCDILTDALQKFLHQQQSQELAQVYAVVSDLWRRFRPERDWQIELDSDGVLKVRSHDREFHFSHLSGGEKTVLLVLARVVLCKLLSGLDFMLIDEPLEHLDIRNRRSLLNFLVEAHRKGIMPQLLITTFEETLVRKFYQAAGVTPIFLSREH